MRIRPWLKSINLFIVIITGLALIAPFINPQSFWWSAILGVSFPWLWLINVLFLLYWVVKRLRYFLWSFLILLLSFNHMLTFLGFNVMASSQKGDGVKLLSFNCYGLRNPDSRELVKDTVWNQFIQDMEADIIAFQEFPAFIMQRKNMAKYLRELNHMRYRSGGKRGGLALFSKYPITYEKDIYFANRSNGILISDLNVAGKMVRVINLHLQSNAVARMANRVATKGGLTSWRTMGIIKRMLNNYKNSAILRVEQGLYLQRIVESSPYPVILMGDLNEVPQSFLYRQLTQQLKDAFWLYGAGLGVSYDGPIPGLKIDYIFTDPKFEVQKSTIVRWKEVSDHFPITSIIHLPQGN